jgi:hypothetical protein
VSLLPGEERVGDLRALAGSNGHASSQQLNPDSRRNVVTYQWTQFHGKEETTEFDLDSHFDLEGHFQCNSSAGHKEYQDRLRAIYLRGEGKSKADIAKILDRSDKFVSKWWQKDVKEVPRPYGVHAYLALENGGAFGQGAKKSEASAMDAATHWRDVEIRRDFAKDDAVYTELLNNAEWKQAEGSTTRDFRTGARHLKYDKEGNIRLQGYMRAKYTKGQSPALDRALQKIFSTYGIESRTSGILLNYYEDGKMMLGSHRHDCWTALLSFGSDRILTIDNTPVLCRDGDLINFGTQRHGVPLMPAISTGRITVPVFFYPDKLQKQAMWQTITDAEEAAPSSKLATMQTAANLAASAMHVDLWFSHHAEIRKLCELGFDEEVAMDALTAHDFDMALATQALLVAFDRHVLPGVVSSVEGGPLGSAALPGAVGAPGSSGSATCCSAGASGSSSSRWRRRRAVDHAGAEDRQGAPSDTELDDEKAALAAQIMATDEASPQPPPLSDDEAASQAAALALHLEELDRTAGVSSECLQAQFQQYEAELDRLDAEERWNGTNGDLMAFRQAQEHLSLEDMEKATLHSIGHGDMSERAFFEMLQVNSIRVLYDIRPTDYRHELVGVPERFSAKGLKMACKSRGIFYKQMVIGRETAYGTLAHLRSQQGRHVLVELAWQGKRKPTAFLGRASDWRQDPRLAVAQDLCAAGHRVRHVLPDGSQESHATLETLPDWLTGEADRLRKLEKQRQAGELKRPEKSAVDRSSEAVASHLMRPAVEVDAMAALQDAETQPELKLVQQKLVRLQRHAEKHELRTKALTRTPQFIKEEAREQEAWIAQRKMEKKKAASAEAPSGSAPGADSVLLAAGSSLEHELQVECVGCGAVHDWAQLQHGDGRCAACCSGTSSGTAGSSGAAAASSSTRSCSSAAADGDDLLVECTHCTKTHPWALLALGDGQCPRCFEERAAVEATAESGTEARPVLEAVSGGRWQARRRHAAAS